MPSPRLRWRLLAAALAGCTGALASAPLEQHWTQWLGFALLLGALDDLDRRRSMLVGWAAGFAANLALFSWLALAMNRFGDMSWATAIGAFVLYAALCGSQYALLGLLDHTARARAPRWRGVTFVAAFAAVEWVWPQLFSWTMGAAQLQCRPLAQLAELGGTILVTAVILAPNVALHTAWTERRDGVPWARVLPWLGVFAAAYAWGGYRAGQVEAQIEAAPTARVALVQPNVLPFRPREQTTEKLERLAADVQTQGLDLVVWPESAAPYPWLVVQEPVTDTQRRFDAVARDSAVFNLEQTRRLIPPGGVTTLIGANLWEVTGSDADMLFIHGQRNTLLVFDPQQQRPVGRYDKHELLVIGEFLPGERWFPWLRDLAPYAGDYSAGPGPEVLTLPDGLRVGPLICYEAVPPDLCRAVAAVEPPDLWVNVTNDVWFGDTQGPFLHRMIVGWRAIETRRSLVRATNTGRSVAALPDGRFVAQTGWDQATIAYADVPLLTGPPTVYARFGNAWIAGLAAVWLGLVARGAPTRPAPDGT